MRGVSPWTAWGLPRATSTRSFASGLQPVSSALAVKQQPSAVASSRWETLKLCGFTLGVVEGSFWLAGQLRQQHWSLKQTDPSPNSAYFSFQPHRYLASRNQHGRLWVFGELTEMAVMLGSEQFLAFYILAAVVGNLAGHLGLRTARKGWWALGASGAVYAVFGLLASTLPPRQLHFLPFVDYTTGLSNILAACMALDVLVIVLG
ncbi:hypothetical protein WJX74_001135 [Apatococcus lobatus]|uniref:Peptidase S54 rhomboid domain-containing protein n=1 Tax=Apatococcus lobatus TaxID=904363 RepID=A0AAW1RD98_9CHLO